MMHRNQFGIEPGPYRCGDNIIVVITIVTHRYVLSDIKEMIEPTVIYRDLEFSMDKHVAYSILISDFKEKFTPVTNEY